MEGGTYSTKEWIAELRKDMNQRFDKVDEAQAHTNGDVTSLKLWRAYLTGGLAVITAIVIPLCVYEYNQAHDSLTKLQAITNTQQTYGTQNK